MYSHQYIIIILTRTLCHLPPSRPNTSFGDDTNEDCEILEDHFPYSLDELVAIKSELKTLYKSNKEMEAEITQMNLYYNHHFRFIESTSFGDLRDLIFFKYPLRPVFYWNDFFKGDIFQMERFDLLIFDDFLFSHSCVIPPQQPSTDIHAIVNQAFTYDNLEFTDYFDTEINDIDKLFIPLIGVLYMRLNFYFLEYFNFQPAFTKSQWADRLHNMFVVRFAHMGEFKNFENQHDMYIPSNVDKILKICKEITDDKTSNMYLLFKDFNDEIYLHSLHEPELDFYCNPEVIYHIITGNYYVRQSIVGYEIKGGSDDLPWITHTTFEKDYVRQWKEGVDRRLKQVEPQEQEIENLL